MLPPLDVGPAAILGVNEDTFARLSVSARRHERAFRVAHPDGTTIQIVLTHPDEVRHVLVTRPMNYPKGRAAKIQRAMVGDGLLTSEGETWRSQRKQLQPIFHERVLSQVASSLTANADALAGRWADEARAGRSIDVSDELGRHVLDTVLQTILSEDLTSLRDAGGASPFDLLADGSPRDLSLIPRFRSAVRHVAEIVERRRHADRWPMDLLTMLYRALEPGSAEQLCDQFATLLVGAHETTAATLPWVLWRLSHDPGCQAAVEDEADRAAGFADLLAGLRRSTPARDAFFETLRLYPPAWLLDRRVVSDEEVAGWRFPTASELFIPIYFLHRDARFFPDPEAFRPARFTDYALDRRYADSSVPAPDDRRVRAATEHYTFIPFGSGSRRCIGDQLAIAASLGYLRAIARRVRFDPGPPVEVQARMTLGPTRPIVLRPQIREDRCAP